jgi:hypothetical protein
LKSLLLGPIVAHLLSQMNDKDLLQLKEYLLGKTSDEVREQLEQKLMTVDEVYDEVEAAEAELIDEYLRNELSAADRAKFEEHFLAVPERRENVRFAQAFQRYLSALPQPVPSQNSFFDRVWTFQPFFVRAAAAFAVVLIVVGGVWILSRDKTPQTFASLSLTISSGDRAEGAQSTKVTLPSNVDALKISLKIPPGQCCRARCR